MQRHMFAFAAGGLFGAGLFLSGMTDTSKVLGWLDVFGQWDPTLAFVMGGAIAPMALAWFAASHRKAPILGGDFPELAPPQLDRNLVVGSVIFGLGWGLAGLCPGPGIASLSYGGWQHWVFVLAMVTGMRAAPIARQALDRSAPAT